MKIGKKLDGKMHYSVEFSWNPEFREILDIFPSNLNLLKKLAILETPTVFSRGWKL
jgi:hypothetical protein